VAWHLVVKSTPTDAKTSRYRTAGSDRTRNMTTRYNTEKHQKTVSRYHEYSQTQTDFNHVDIL